MGTTYSIKEVAEKINRSKHTIKRWQREGLIIPKRNDKGHLMYTEDDIKKLERIKEIKVSSMLQGGIANEQ